MGLKIIIHLFLGVLLLTYVTSCTPRSKLKSKAEAVHQGRARERKDVQQTKPIAVAGRDVTVSKGDETRNAGHGTTLSELYKTCRKSVFMVYTSNGEAGYQGSGFFVSSTGWAVSNYHVFKGTTRGRERIKTSDDELYRIERVYEADEENDYIIFKVDLQGRSVAYLPIAKTRPLVGEEVFAIGNPRGLEQTLSTGIISSHRNGENQLQTTAEITHGSSGGALINMNGEVVGITTSGMGEANLNFAVDIQVLPLGKLLKKGNSDN